MPIEWHRLKYSKGTPRVVAKMRTEKLQARADHRVYARVHARDGRRCFFPRCWTPASDAHHIRPRSLRGPTVTRNLLSSCRRHHQWFKAGLIYVRGNPDRGPVKVHLTALGKEAGLRVPTRLAA